jgi:hypothetical protein
MNRRPAQAVSDDTSSLDFPWRSVRTYRAMRADLPMRELKRRLSWVGFLEPLSEEELDALVRRASFVRLEEGDELVLGPEEQAERMVILVAGQLQVYEVSLGSGREPSWISLHDPTTGEWHDFPTRDCLPSIVEEANGKRRTGRAA